MSTKQRPEQRHVTLRSGFAILVGLLVLTLYFLWAVYGAAPTSLSFLAQPEEEPQPVTPMAGMEVEAGSMDSMAMAGHGAGVGAMSPEEFEEITYRFIDDLALPDGSVRPTRDWTEMFEMEGMGGETAEESGMEEGMEAAGHDGEAAEEDPIDVYLMAQRFSYVPGVLRLEAGHPYRFRMMSTDVNHGASIHTGFAGHIMRRPAMVLTEMVMTFPDRGNFMMYCTVYCGAGHDQMKGKIIVE